MKISAGKMDRKVILQRATESQNTIGHTVQNWANYLTFWAQAMPVSGNEVFRSARDIGTQAIKFTTRYFSDISEKDRLSYDNQYWDILYIREIGRRDEIEILAEAIR